MSQSVQADPLQSLFAQASDANAQNAIFMSLMAGTATATMVLVKAVYANGTAGPARVDVQPMVHQIDGSGNAVPHGIVHGLPCARIQGGGAGIAVDPVVGDIGAAVFASRDISAAIQNRAPSQPGSLRRYDMADGMYFGTLLGGPLTDYIRIQSGAIALSTTGTMTINANSIAITSNSLTHNGKNIGATHTHSGVTTGGGTTGAPT